MQLVRPRAGSRSLMGLNGSWRVSILVLKFNWRLRLLDFLIQNLPSPKASFYCAQPMRFGSRGSNDFFEVSDTSPKCIDQEGLGRRHTGTGQIQTLAVNREECYLDVK